MEDLPYLAEVEKAAAALFPPEVLPECLRESAAPLAVLEEAVCNRALWVARFSGEGGAALPVGFALLSFVDELAYLAELDVLPEHGRKGLGRGLIHEAAVRAREEGFSALHLTTFRKLPWNAPFYSRLGFEFLESDKSCGVLPWAIEAILEEEKAQGMNGRVAMRLDLSGNLGLLKASSH